MPCIKDSEEAKELFCTACNINKDTKFPEGFFNRILSDATEEIKAFYKNEAKSIDNADPIFNFVASDKELNLIMRLLNFKK